MRWTINVRRFRKIALSDYSFIMSVRSSDRMEQLGSHWTEFHEISYLRMVRKSVEASQVSLKPDKNKGTWREDQYTFF